MQLRFSKDGQHSVTARRWRGGAFALLLAFWSLQASAQTIVTVTPASGPASGGTIVMIDGIVQPCPLPICLRLPLRVRFGNELAFFTRINDTSIRAVTPPHAAGQVDISIREGIPGGGEGPIIGIAPNAFTYLDATAEPIPTLPMPGLILLGAGLALAALVRLRT